LHAASSELAGDEGVVVDERGVLETSMSAAEEEGEEEGEDAMAGADVYAADDSGVGVV
jgi:hypothetical protein